MLNKTINLCLESLIQSYQDNLFAPKAVVDFIYTKIKDQGERGVWTYLVPKDQVLERVNLIEALGPEERSRMPLWGVPFSVKDCIDIKGIPTSAACPDFSYIPENTNPVVQKILDAGGILIGKTNLDQFATGLVGIRTGFEVPCNPFDADYIPGGSSSGAAVSVSLGLVSFAVGTDTGGSGRVPAGFNNIVGLKPTRGLLSTTYTVHACRSLDCLSIFALTASDALDVFNIVQWYDSNNPLSRPNSDPPARLANFTKGQAFCFGVPKPSQRAFFGNVEVERLFDEAIEALCDLGGTCIEIDYSPFLAANELLFSGSWVAERYNSVGKFIEDNPDSVYPVTRKIIMSANEIKACQAFDEIYLLEQLKRKVYPLWDQIDILMVPTTGTIYKIKDVEENPLQLNSTLGYYTNFVNLLDLAAIAVPNGFQSTGLPTGVTLVSLPFTEKFLTGVGQLFHAQRVKKLGATEWEFDTAKT
jgi:allophanate hydrolase